MPTVNSYNRGLPTDWCGGCALWPTLKRGETSGHRICNEPIKGSLRVSYSGACTEFKRPGKDK